ncbi:MAG TPA: condensation domain-containing protein, partial [Chitinophagaceae bacterium]|nr:condensation domain-containing protein [Chitinophagaceae bacterium]
IVEGLIPLSPVQQYFFEQNDVDNHHYNQSVLLQSKKPILEKDLKAALDKLVLHHDALRMVYKKIDNVWMQENKGATQRYSLEILDVQDEENFQAHCNRIQSSIDLQHGPLLKIALFKNPEQADRLLIVCHHLVIDGVSWRILLEDLSTLYQQSLLHQSLTLPLKTDSFQYWLQKQIEYANSNTLEKEENYWSTLAQQSIDLLPIDNTQAANTVHDTAEETFIVDANITQQLLTQSYKAYQTDINDILITALTLAVHQTFNIKHIAITLEGHGREQIVDDIDISRTVGWFTSLYPVVINVQHHDTLIRHAIEVKEVLHRIPNKGVGYGILCYLAKKTYTLQPQIIFNYLGNIEASVTNTEGHQMFEFLGEAHGREISINSKRNHILDISGITVNNQLRLSISYSSQQYNTSTIKRLVDAYQQQLTKLIQQLAAEHTTHITPVDLTYKALTIDQVQQLNFNHNLEDVYPASPLQEGLYYHWFTHPDSLAYFDQISYQVQGHLDMDKIEKSYQQLNDRHAILRTYFTQALSDQLLQVVQKKSDHNFSYIDVTKQPSSIRDQYKKEDIAKGFDLHKGSQMRLALIKLDNTHYEFIWSFHHILMDGWCVGILIKEFFEIYESLLKDQQPELPKVHSYANYIQWLDTIDQKESYTYWKNYLQDYDAVSSLYPAPLNQPSNYTIQSKTIHTTEAIRQSIKTLCNTLAITENTFIQTAWGILLSKYNNTNDVVFGSVVSGRPAEIEGIEEMIGLFINTIPIRVQLPEQISVADILKKIQQQSAEATKYHYTQLAEVQSQSELGNRLFDHIMVFENYPVQDMIAQNMRSKQNEEVDILSSDVFEQTGYPLTLTVHPDEKAIQVRFSYNAALYTEEQIDQAQQHFIRIIETIVHNPQQHINEIDCLGDKEKQQLLVDFNDTEVEYDKDKTIIDLFEEQVIKTPNTIAILFENKTLT